VRQHIHDSQDRGGVVQHGQQAISIAADVKHGYDHHLPAGDPNSHPDFLTPDDITGPNRKYSGL
jgi:hypothetical protein